MLLTTAVSARIPLVAVELDDPLNAQLVLSELVGEKVHSMPKKRGTDGVTYYDMEKLAKGHVYVLRKPSSKLDFDKLYSLLGSLGSVAIIVNPKEQHHAFFDAGLATCPPSLVRKFVKEHLDEEHLDEAGEALVASLSGLSYKAMIELTLMAQTRHGEFTARAVQDLRRSLFGDIRGLRQIGTEAGFYLPGEDLQQWLGLDGELFLHSKHAELVPRGLLFAGPPGTGKSEGAKFIARSLNLPLYLLDISGAMNKYIGESESALRRSLAQVDECGPCVMLVDEVEKLFAQGSNGDSGTTTRMLSSLLWWLQEHRSRVLTVMTTNNENIIPPELIRPGRIDAVMQFQRLTVAPGLAFMKAQAKQSEHLAKVPGAALSKLHEQVYGGVTQRSQAELSAAVLGLVKKMYFQKIHK